MLAYAAQSSRDRVVCVGTSLRPMQAPATCSLTRLLPLRNQHSETVRLPADRRESGAGFRDFLSDEPSAHPGHPEELP